MRGSRCGQVNIVSTCFVKVSLSVLDCFVFVSVNEPNKKGLKNPKQKERK
jgi:hypothetical protein